MQLTINRVSSTTELRHYYTKLHKREGTAVLKKLPRNKTVAVPGKMSPDLQQGTSVTQVNWNISR